ncbi:hypothetical protein [Salibacterium qingdaonense]|uniref:Uncharacterized protein n=1 Tax=Salibacterium qingdaonense TaxID=266892 RepID=A0A1I4L852_9BACI|nr:hypothetical protein [Salibacterium qingdaonense]SFL87192.1 hypothetical protein SAMN04488054_10720 [Salibacterium qingdaonense]
MSLLCPEGESGQERRSPTKRFLYLDNQQPWSHNDVFAYIIPVKGSVRWQCGNPSGAYAKCPAFSSECLLLQSVSRMKKGMYQRNVSIYVPNAAIYMPNIPPYRPNPSLPAELTLLQAEPKDLLSNQASLQSGVVTNTDRPLTQSARAANSL